MKKRDKHSEVFIKYLLSYILILLIPVIIMGFIVYNIFLDVFKSEVIRNNSENLNYSRSIIDEQIRQVRNTSSQILEGNNDLKPFSLLGNAPIKDIRIRNVLYSYTSSNTFINEVVLYLRGDEYIYSSRGSYTFPMFINSIYNYKNWSSENFYKDITTISEPIIRPAESVNGDDRFVTFIYPFSPSTGNPFASLLFIIKEKSFQKLLENNIKDYIGNSMIVDKDNRIITSIKDDEYMHSNEFFDAINLDNTEEVKIVTLNNKKWFLCVMKSKEINWKYITVIPVSSIMKEVSNIQVVFIYGMIFILLLGGIFIYFSMNLNYKPLRQLKIHTEKIFNNTGGSLDDFQRVREAIDFLSFQNGELSNKIKDNSGAIKNNLIFALLKGEINIIEDFNLKGMEVNVSFTRSMFWVLVLKVHSKNEFQESNVINLLEKNIPEEYEGYARDHFKKNEYILILSSNEESQENTYEKLQLLQKCCKDELGAVITIGVGNKYRELSRISQSYIEASTAIKHRFIKGNDRVIFFTEIDIKQTKFKDYPREEIEGLKEFIRRRNVRKIEAALEYITNFIKQNEIPLFMARGICFEIINIVTLSRKEMSDEFIVVKNEYPDIFLLETLETIEDFINLIRDICNDICSNIQIRYEKEEDKLTDKIISYIKQNFDNCDFSIQDVAEHFAMNSSYMSQYFKAHFNQTIIDHITELRIDKAKKILIASGISLKYVAEETGYYNVSSFIRRFKQVTGITPGQYRDENK